MKNMSGCVINCLTQRLVIVSQSNKGNSCLFETQVSLQLQTRLHFETHSPLVQFKN